jgi:hypothetical protein
VNAPLRESAAKGVDSRPLARITSPKPGASRGAMERTASGVTSRGPKPVPPVQRIKSISPESAHFWTAWAISSISSGTMFASAIIQPI